MTITSEHDTQVQAFLQSFEKAETGDAQAQYQTGLYYAQGTGVAQNYRKAGYYWLSAAKQSHPAAQTYLGILFEKGLGYKQDLDRAIHCYQSAANLGFAEAKVRLAMLYLTGKGLPQDVKKAILLFIQAAQQGEVVAQYNLAIAYEKGLGGLKHNDDLAHFWYHQAAYQHHPQAMARLQAEKFAQKPAEPTLPENFTTTPLQTDQSVTDTSTTNTSVIDGLATTTFSANLVFEQVADLTSSSVGNDHATLIADNPVEANTAALDTPSFEVDELFVAPTQQVSFDDDLPVHPDSDVMFAKGVVAIQEDIKKAFDYFKQAALLGHAKAEYNMGLAFLYGLGGNPICIESAIEWLEKSANQSFRPAYVVLGWLYQGGNVYLDIVSDNIGEAIIVDHDMAISHFEMASELGHAQAQYFLSKIYATGNGVTADTDKSAAWLKQSAKHGYLAAVNQLRQISPDATHNNPS